MSEPAAPATIAAWPIAARASAIGATLTAAVLTAIVLLASAETLPAPVRPYLLVGAFVGAASGTLGNIIVARGSLRRVGGAEASADFLRALVMDFALQAVAVAGGTVAVRFLLTVKFQEFATFGMTLAGAVALFRIPGTIMVTRALDRRARGTRGTATAGAAPKDSN